MQTQKITRILACWWINRSSHAVLSLSPAGNSITSPTSAPPIYIMPSTRAIRGFKKPHIELGNFVQVISVLQNREKTGKKIHRGTRTWDDRTDETLMITDDMMGRVLTIGDEAYTSLGDIAGWRILSISTSNCKVPIPSHLVISPVWWCKPTRAQSDRPTYSSSRSWSFITGKGVLVSK